MEDNIIYSLRSLADLDKQKLSWKGKLPNVISSFIEEVNTLYDFGFEYYIEEMKKQSSGSQLLSKLIELDEMISNYESEGKSDDEILNDSEWIYITHKAQEILNLL